MSLDVVRIGARKVLKHLVSFAGLLPRYCFNSVQKCSQEKCRACKRHFELINQSSLDSTKAKVVVCAPESVPGETLRCRQILLAMQFPKAEVTRARLCGSKISLQSSSSSLLANPGCIDLLVMEASNQTGFGVVFKYTRLVSRLKPSHAWFHGAVCENGIHPLTCWAFYMRLLRWFVKDSLPTIGDLLIMHSVRQIARLVPRAKKIPSDRDRILISTQGYMGDLVIYTPALRALRMSYPDAYLIFLTTPIGQKLLGECPYIDKLIVYRPESPDIADLIAYRSGLRVLSYAHLALEIASYKCKLSLHIGQEMINAATFIPFMAGIKHRIGNEARNSFQFKLYPFTQRVFVHQSSTYRRIGLDIVQACGAQACGQEMECWVPAEARQSVHSRFVMDDDRRIVVIHPGTSVSSASRRWPAHKYAQLIDLIYKRWPSIRIFLTGTSHETSLLNWIADNCSAPVEVLNEQLTIPELMALIEMSSLIITNDTGPLHIALALKTPVVAIFGPNNPEIIVGPIDDPGVRFRALRAKTGCTTNVGCPVYLQADVQRQNTIRWNCLQPDMVCTDAVDVSDAMRAVEELEILNPVEVL